MQTTFDRTFEEWKEDTIFPNCPSIGTHTHRQASAISREPSRGAPAAPAASKKDKEPHAIALYEMEAADEDELAFAYVLFAVLSPL